MTLQTTPMFSLKNIIFDWSGTLFDDFALSYHSTVETLTHFGGPAISLEEYKKEFCLPVLNFYLKYIPNATSLLEQIDTFYFDHFSSKIVGGFLFPGVREALLIAKEKGFQLFIVSTVRQSLLEILCKREGIDHFFTEIKGSASDKKVELPLLCQRQNLSPEETLYVGDLSHDIQSAHHAGFHAGVFLSGYGKTDDLLAEAPNFIWNDPLSFLKFLHHIETFPEKQKIKLVSKRPIPTVGGLLTFQGKIFLIQTHKWSHKIGIPGGKIEAGETMEEALAREMMEETGMAISNIRFALVQDAIDPPQFAKRGKHFLLINFFAEVKDPTFILNHEAYSGIWVDPLIALRLTLNKPTQVLLEYYLNNLK